LLYFCSSSCLTSTAVQELVHVLLQPFHIPYVNFWLLLVHLLQQLAMIQTAHTPLHLGVRVQSLMQITNNKTLTDLLMPQNISIFTAIYGRRNACCIKHKLCDSVIFDQIWYVVLLISFLN